MANKADSGILLVWLLLIFCPLGISGQESGDMPLLGPRLTLDGTLKADEWEGATRHRMTSNGDVLLMTRGTNLSLGVRGPGFGLAHVAVASPDTVWVLHASAALGSIVYARGPEGWDKVRDPVWEVRDPTLDPAAVQARGAYFAANGWVATTGRMGLENEVEFLVQTDRFGGDELRFAVVFFPMGPAGSFPRWPETAGDDVDEEKLLTGPMPERLHFDPASWAQLIFD
jgi:hypothetical protein